MAKHGKKYTEALKQVDKNKSYTAEEAVELLKKVDYAKFDATVEVAINLDVDPKQADQQIRGAIVLTVQVKLKRLSSSLKDNKLRMQKQPALISLVQTTL